MIYKSFQQSWQYFASVHQTVGLKDLNSVNSAVGSIYYNMPDHCTQVVYDVPVCIIHTACSH